MSNPANREKQLARVKACNKRFREELRTFIGELKDVPCMDCGLRYEAVCMDFDHRPGTIKLMNISNAIGSRSGGRMKVKALILDEATKCDIVCANCHRLRTKARGQNRIPGSATKC